MEKEAEKEGRTETGHGVFKMILLVTKARQKCKLCEYVGGKLCEKWETTRRKVDERNRERRHIITTLLREDNVGGKNKEERVGSVTSDQEKTVYRAG